MRRQPEPIYATLLETFQQAMEHIYLLRRTRKWKKTTATRAKPLCGRVDALNVKVYIECKAEQNNQDVE